MTCSTPSPLYQPLDTSKSQIRLLQFRRTRGHNQHQDIITYTLSTVSLQDSPEFSALSYVWGDPTITKPITVNNHTLQVTTNLADGLRSLVDQLDSLVRDGENTINHFRLWVDAICVNQDDVAKRNYQVQLMRGVYSSAEHVLAWLGISSKRGERRMLARGLRGVNVVYEAIKNLSYEEFSSLSWATRCPFLTGRFDLSNKSSVDKSWIAVITLLRLPYWRRLWIVQETAFARSLVLFCKNGALEAHKLELFGDYFGRFQKDYMESTVLCPPSVTFGCWINTTGDRVNYSPLDRLRTVREHARRLRSVDYAHDDGFDSGWIVSTMTHGLVATDRMDYIYGLLGLSGIDIVPAYDREVHFVDVCRQYVVSWLETHGNKPTNSASRLSELFFLSPFRGWLLFPRQWGLGAILGPSLPFCRICMVTSELHTASTDTGLGYNNFSREKPSSEETQAVVWTKLLL